MVLLVPIYAGIRPISKAQCNVTGQTIILKLTAHLIPDVTPQNVFNASSIWCDISQMLQNEQMLLQNATMVAYQDVVSTNTK